VNATTIALLAALPWIVVPWIVWWRARDSRDLSEESPRPPIDAPVVSVIIPARDEARNIGDCVRSVLATTYPAVEVVVVDDHSTDDTAALARDAAAGDHRLRVVDNPPLPADWLGKPWACATGAAAARGDVLCFVDADTRQAPELLARAVNAMRLRGADLLSVAGTQVMGGFWERVVQPQVFAVLAARFGGTETVNRSPRVQDKIANGQCILVRRDAYERLGGHGIVRDRIAEDLMLAQRFFAAGMRVSLVLGVRHLFTRMYTSLAELVRGWSKNVFAGGVDAMPAGRLGIVLFPFLLLLPPLLNLAPPAVLLAALAAPLPPALLLWAAVATAASLAFWGASYWRIGQPVWYALAFPLGAAVLLFIDLRAIARGRRVSWKGREYLTTRA
jgi:hypothetical protein